MSRRADQGAAEERSANRYRQVIERIFLSHFRPGMNELAFGREEVDEATAALGLPTISNVGDSIYFFRYRAALPESISSRAPEGLEWHIYSSGRGRYRFVAKRPLRIVPNEALSETKVPDATPEIVAMYSSGDEQALLTKVRYNRLIDIFTGVTCYSIQNHLRATVPGVSQVETDEIYVGIDRRGAHFAVPVQAKAEREALGRVQIEQDLALCAHRFPGAICIPVGAQFVEGNKIALFSFEQQGEDIAVLMEKHYRLVPHDSISPAELAAYRVRPTE